MIGNRISPYAAFTSRLLGVSALMLSNATLKMSGMFAAAAAEPLNE